MSELWEEGGDARTQGVGLGPIKREAETNQSHQSIRPSPSSNAIPVQSSPVRSTPLMVTYDLPRYLQQQPRPAILLLLHTMLPTLLAPKTLGRPPLGREPRARSCFCMAGLTYPAFEASLLMLAVALVILICPTTRHGTPLSCRLLVDLTLVQGQDVS